MKILIQIILTLCRVLVNRYIIVRQEYTNLPGFIRKSCQELNFDFGCHKEMM